MPSGQKARCRLWDQPEIDLESQFAAEQGEMRLVVVHDGW
jgi:hypothetical protein